MPSAPSRGRWRPTRSLGSWQSTNWAIRAIDKFGADCLFQIISHRYERGATLLTTNRIYKQWADIFTGDATLTSALLDRLLDHVETVLIEGKSYRGQAHAEA